jgi:hypothetical protein
MAASPSWRTVLEAALAEHGVEGLADRAVETLEREAPLLLADPDLRDLARRSSAANLELVADIARGRVGLGDVEPPPQAAAFARELARRNVPMSELARAYRVVQHLMWRFGTAELRRRLPDDASIARAIEGYTDATFVTGEALMSRALERYARERERWVRSADAVRRATVEALLDGGGADVDAASARLRYELRRRHVAYVVWAEGDDTVVESAAAAAGGPGALVVPLRSGMVAGWCAPAAFDPDAVGRDARLAFGQEGEGLAGFRRSHGEALEARRVARLGAVRGPVAYADVALVALLTTDLERALAFARAEAGQLAGTDSQTARLADTVLEVLGAQGSPRRAGQRLGLHENTVAKRVRAAEALLGRAIDERPARLLAALLILRATRPTAREDAPAPLRARTSSR